MFFTLEERRPPWFLQKVRIGLVSYGPLKKLYFLFYGRLDLFEFDLNLWTWQDLKCQGQKLTIQQPKVKNS
jgi:hypothetical protein